MGGGAPCACKCGGTKGCSSRGCDDASVLCGKAWLPWGAAQRSSSPNSQPTLRRRSQPQQQPKIYPCLLRSCHPLACCVPMLAHLATGRLGPRLHGIPYAKGRMMTMRARCCCAWASAACAGSPGCDAPGPEGEGSDAEAPPAHDEIKDDGTVAAELEGEHLLHGVGVWAAWSPFLDCGCAHAGPIPALVLGGSGEGGGARRGGGTSSPPSEQGGAPLHAEGRSSIVQTTQQAGIPYRTARALAIGWLDFMQAAIFSLLYTAGSRARWLHGVSAR